MYSILVLTALWLVLHTLAQECSFPNQRCICMTSTALCRCPYITSDSTLDYTSSYKSHLVMATNFGCLPCPAACLECSSTTACTSCREEYVLVGSSCVSCPINCKKCKPSSQININKPLPMQCIECKLNYYIDSRLECQRCPLQGTSECTIDSLKSCMASYWLDNNGAACIKCDINCRQCSSTTKCSVCNDGYYLSAYKCWKCADQCETCANDTSCGRCAASASYYNANTGGCVKCETGCLQCTNATVCVTCGDLNQTVYTLLANGTCVVTVSPLLHCAQHVYSSTSLKCTRCQPHYFQQTGTADCSYGCSVLCRECQGAHYGLCTKCQDSSVLFNRQCIPKNSINDGTAFQIYYTAMNNYNTSVFAYTPNASLVTRLANTCLKESVVQAPAILLQFDNLQAYKLQLLWKAYIFSANASAQNGYSVTFSNANTTSVYNFTCANIMPESACASICISKWNISIASNLLQFNNLTFAPLSSTSTIGLSQVLATAYRCAGIQGSTCLQCSQINTCTKCVDPSYFILAEKCVQECPPSYYVHYLTRKCYKVCPLGTFGSEKYDGTHHCYTCPSECLTCSSNFTCFSCSPGFYFIESGSSCIKSCPSRYFPNLYMRKCEKCPYPCLQCLSNRQCLSCMYGFYENTTQTCTITCPYGYYGNLSTRGCQRCVDPCASCQMTSSMCTDCIDGYIQFYGMCYKECPDGYHKQSANTNESIMGCVGCNISCSSCVNATYCTGCASGYLLNGSCFMACPIGYYASPLTQNCQPCASNCLLCTNLTHCSLCKPSYAQDSAFGCVEKCPHFYYAQEQNYSLQVDISLSSIYLTCRPCIQPCYLCTSYNHCTACKYSFLLGGSCVDACISGTYPNESNLTCAPCPQNCSTCQSADACLSCVNDFILFEQWCIEECPPFHYKDTAGLCSACALDCCSCSNNTFCLNCTLGLVSTGQGLCVQDCPAGYWADRWQTRSCVKCMAYCQICSYDQKVNKQQCLLCQPLYYLSIPLSNGNLSSSSSSRCVSECGSTQFGLGGLCYACILPCYSCLSQSQCVRCMPGYGYALMGECLPECPLGYYQDEHSGKGGACVECPSTCISCSMTGSTSAVCHECRDGYFLDRHNGICVTASQCQTIESSPSTSSPIPSVGVGYFGQHTSKQCLRCSSRCRHCQYSAHNCLSCDGAYKFHNHECLVQCPRGYYSLNNTCVQCDTATTTTATDISNSTGGIKCSECYDASTCLTCAPPYYLYSTMATAACLADCPAGYFGSGGLCHACQYPCIQCNTITNCSICQSTHVHLLAGYTHSCVQDCPSGYYKYINASTTNHTSSLECIPCPAHCLQCQNSTSCYVCDRTSALVDGTCVTDCPPAMFRFYGTCSSCMHGCAHCQDSYTCDRCLAGFLYEGQCITQCPFGLIEFTSNNRNICLQCSQQCMTCKVEPHICTSCTIPLFLYLQKCIPACLPGSYPVHEISQCVTCSKPCQTCANSHSCETCIYGYILYIEQNRKQCVKGPLCPNSYYLDVSNNVCKLGCSSSEYSQLISRTCSPSCPQGFAAYDANMTCLYSCPQTSMWVDQHIKCQDNKFLLPTQFITEKLPTFNCISSNYRSLLQIHCIFSLPIANLKSIRFSNIFVEGMQILHIFVSDDNRSFKMIVQPSDQISTKFIKKWLTISIRPRYMFKTYQATQRATNSQRHLQSSNYDYQASYPQQNSDATAFVPLFTFYNQEQREAGLYLSQLSKSISIAAIIVWVFSILKNKKSMALAWINGLQWLFTLSLLGQNHFPSNIIHFLEGFKLSLLILTDSITFIDLSNNLWFNSNQIRPQLISPVNIMDYKTLALPIACFISIFVAFFLALFMLKGIFKKLRTQNSETEYNVSQHDSRNNQNQGQQKKTAKSNRSNKSIKSKGSDKSVNQKQKNFVTKMLKRVSILLQRFRFNYVHHILLLISMPASLLAFSQLLSPNILGFLLGIATTLLLLISWMYTAKLSLCNKYSLFKQQSYKYYIVSSIQNFIIGFFCVMGTFSLFMGATLIIFVFNLYILFAIFRYLEWRLRFWFALEALRILICGVLMVCHLAAQQWDRNSLFNFGWVPIIIIIFYVIMLAICAARDFFEQESIAFKQLMEQQKLRKINKKLTFNKGLLENLENQDGHNEQNKKQKPILISCSVVEYESEQSFFEDQEEVTHTDSEDQDIQHSFSISNKQRRLQNAPQILIKQSKNV